VTIVVTGPAETEFGSRLEAAGWGKAYMDTDGTVFVDVDRVTSKDPSTSSNTYRLPVPTPAHEPRA
jgi:hypothetical protein